LSYKTENRRQAGTISSQFASLKPVERSSKMPLAKTPYKKSSLLLAID